jgi:hypothetical protein
VIKGHNIVPPLSDEMFVMTAVFVQDSETYLAELNTKLKGKCKLQLLYFLVIKPVKGNSVSWTNIPERSHLSVLKLSVESSTSPENWKNLKDKFIVI